MQFQLTYTFQTYESQTPMQTSNSLNCVKNYQLYLWNKV